MRPGGARPSVQENTLTLSLFNTGEATAGKTQLCLRLLLRAQAPLAAGGLGGTALWIYTEGDPPLRRLAGLAAANPALLGGLAHDPASRVLVDRHVSTPADLMAALDRADSLCVASAGTPSPVSLIIVDSVAAIFRDAATTAGGGGGGDAAAASASGASAYGARAGAMFAAAATLKRLADVHRLAVVAVNQVSDVVAGGDGPAGAVPQPQPPPQSARSLSATGGQVLRTSGRPVAPALGLAWAHCVDTRLFLGRMVAGGAGGWGEWCGRDRDPSAPPAPHALRSLQVVFSPHLPPAFAYCVVTGAGLVGVTAADYAAATGAAGRPPLATREAQGTGVGTGTGMATAATGGAAW